MQASINYRTYDQDSLGVMNLLLQRGAELTLSRNDGWNLLCWAAETGNISVAQEAIRRGVDVNSRDKHGRTPLMYAAANGETHVLPLLLAHSADVNLRDNMGWTALMFAAQSNNLAIVQALLEHRADRQVRDHEKRWTAEQRAIHVGQERIADLLRTGHIGIRQNVGVEERAEWGWGSSISKRPARVVVDAHRWIEGVRCPNIHQDDTVADISRFRHGKLTQWCLVFLPRQ